MCTTNYVYFRNRFEELILSVAFFILSSRVDSQVFIVSNRISSRIIKQCVSEQFSIPLYELPSEGLSVGESKVSLGAGSRD